MIKSKHKLAALGLALGLIFVLALVRFSGTRNPKLTVTYLTRTNNAGQSIGLFAITNVGNAPALGYKLGSVEVFGKAPPTHVAIVHKLHRLLPGEGDVVQVFLPPGVQGRWRFTAEYAHEDIRSRISDWQWGPGGPGVRANWLVPRFLKGVPLNVIATSDWINDDGAKIETK